MPQDRPTTVELIEAVREFLERDVMPIEGRIGFHGRVARNALGIVQRELELQPELDAEYAKLLSGFLHDDETGTDIRTMESDLAHGIRAGTFDDRIAQVAGLVRTAIENKLKVANPEYTEGG